ncbi:ankyrin repeat domain-containing protein [Pontimicrobium sp. MEBiC06410]
MKKTIIIAAAFVFSLTSVNAMTTAETTPTTFKTQPAYNVSAFCVAVVKGDVATVKKLIELGEDVNKMSKGMTPAMYAAKYNRVEVLKLLIAEGANLKKRSAKGKTAKQYAKLTNAEATYALIDNTLKNKK